MKKIICFLVSFLTLMYVANGERESDTDALLRAYMRYSLSNEIRAQALSMADAMEAPEAEQVRDITLSWFEDEIASLRQDLDKRFGTDAREYFARFVDEYTTAENAGDRDYLDRISARTGLREPPPDYAALRRLALERWLQAPLREGTRLLSEMQTWAEVRARLPQTPALDFWLARWAPEPVAEHPPRPPVNPLAAAEAPPAEWSAPRDTSGSSLDAFARRRRERREQALIDAQAGMQQMTMERQAAEQEYGARKLAEAQAEAEAMRSQAHKMAAVEAEAIAQRENSWGNRIKRIVGGTVSAGLGAFTGGIGAEAGRRAADELFR